MPVWILYVVLFLMVLGAALMMMGGAKQPPATDNQLDIPNTKIGTPIPVLFGTRLIKSPTIGWYGDLHIVKVKVDTGGKK